MKSIKTKLIIYFSVLILVSSIGLGVISLLRASSSLTEEGEKSLASLSLEASKLTESRIEIQRRTLETLAVLDKIQSMDWALQQSILQNQVNQGEFLEIGVMSLDGTVHYSSGRTIKLGETDPARKALGGGTKMHIILPSALIQMKSF